LRFTESSAFYTCDPYIPNSFPDISRRDVDPHWPLQFFVGAFAAELLAESGTLIAPAASPLVELGFVTRSRAADLHRPGVQRLLGHVADQLQLQEMVPSIVVAHTSPEVAAVAERDFSFEITSPYSGIPTAREAAICALGKIPTTVFMPMTKFLRVYAP